VCGGSGSVDDSWFVRWKRGTRIMHGLGRTRNWSSLWQRRICHAGMLVSLLSLSVMIRSIVDWLRLHLRILFLSSASRRVG